MSICVAVTREFHCVEILRVAQINPFTLEPNQEPEYHVGTVCFCIPPRLASYESQQHFYNTSYITFRFNVYELTVSSGGGGVSGGAGDH